MPTISEGLREAKAAVANRGRQKVRK